MPFKVKVSTNHNSNDQAVLEPPGLFFKQIQTHTCFKILWFVNGHWGEGEDCIWMSCIFMYLCGFTRVEKFGLAKGDGGEGEVAADEDHVGDAQSGQQVVEHVVHFPISSEIFRIYIIMYMGNNFPSLTFLFLETMLETS